jgi:hypothetical protein
LFQEIDVLSPVAHSLVGASLGIVCMPRYPEVRSRIVFLTTFVCLASIPDWPLPGWGHTRYAISHSVFVNSCIISLVALILAASPSARQRIGGYPVIVCGAFAWLSHLLTDSLYSHAQGIAIYWPVSTARFAMPMPWFDTLRIGEGVLNLHNVRVCLIEFAFYGPLLWAACIIRKSRLGGKDRVQ